MMMKRFTSGWCTAAAMTLLVVGPGLFAQEGTTLTRSQWLKRVGASVSDEAVLRETMTNLTSEDKVEFAQRVIKAATRLPASPEEKSAALIRSSVASIASATGDTKQQVIAKVFAGVPVEYLPVVSEELAKRFDQEFNKLSNEQFEKIASDTLAACIKENAETDSPSVRNTFAILAFLRGAKDPALQNRLIAQLPDERMRNLAASWLPPALKNKNYEAMLAAADVDGLEINDHILLRLVGHANLDRLLADLNANLGVKQMERIDETSIDGAGIETVGTVWVPLSQVRAVGGFVVGSGTSMGTLDHAFDFGINRTPLYYPEGYQNQGTSVLLCCPDGSVVGMPAKVPPKPAAAPVVLCCPSGPSVGVPAKKALQGVTAPTKR